MTIPVSTRRDRVARLQGVNPSTADIPAFWSHLQLSSYGFTNPLNKRNVGISYDSTNMNFVQMLRESAKNVFSYDSILNSGPFLATVLRVEVAPETFIGSQLGQTGYEPEKNNSFVNPVYHNNGEGVNTSSGEKTFFEVKARVNELEILPWPWDQNDDYVIDMYPTFVAEKSFGDQPIKVGDLIWVDFTNTNEGLQGVIEEVCDITPGPVPDVRYPVFVQDKTRPCCSPSPPSGHNIGSGPAKIATADPEPVVKVHGGDIKIMTSAKSLPLTAQVVQAALKIGKAPVGTGWTGHIEGNGGGDFKLRPKGCPGRETLVYVPSALDKSKPIELAYYFHGLRGFGNHFDGNPKHDFEKAKTMITKEDGAKCDFWYRVAPWLKQMVERDKRNIIFVMPELSWSTGYKAFYRSTAKRNSRQPWSFAHPLAPNASWKKNVKGKGKYAVYEDDFVLFHNNVLQLLGGNAFGVPLDKIQSLSWTGHSAGGKVLSNLVTNKKVVKDAGIKPNRITLSDGGYGYWHPGKNKEKPSGWAVCYNIWHFYVKPEAPHYPGKDHWIEWNTFTAGGDPGKNAKAFFTKTPAFKTLSKKWKFRRGSREEKHVFPNNNNHQYVTFKTSKKHAIAALESFPYINPNAAAASKGKLAAGSGASKHTMRGGAKASSAAPGSVSGPTTTTATEKSHKTGRARIAHLEAIKKSHAAYMEKCEKESPWLKSANNESIAALYNEQGTYSAEQLTSMRTMIKRYIESKSIKESTEAEISLLQGVNYSNYHNLSTEELKKQLEQNNTSISNLKAGKTPTGASSANSPYESSYAVKATIKKYEQVNLVIQKLLEKRSTSPGTNNKDCIDCGDETTQTRRTVQPSNNFKGTEAKRTTTGGSGAWYKKFGNKTSSLFPIHIDKPNPGNPDDHPSGADVDSKGVPKNYPDWLINKWCPGKDPLKVGRGPRHIGLGKTNPKFKDGNETRGLIAYACLEIIENYWNQGFEIVGGDHAGTYNDAKIFITSHSRKNTQFKNHDFNGATDIMIRFDNNTKMLPAIYLWASVQILMKTYRLPTGGSGLYMDFKGNRNRIKGLNYYEQGNWKRKKYLIAPGAYANVHYDFRGHFDFKVNKRRARGMASMLTNWMRFRMDDKKPSSKAQYSSRTIKILEQTMSPEKAKQLNNFFKQVYCLSDTPAEDFTKEKAGQYLKFKDLTSLKMPSVGPEVPNLNQMAGLGAQKDNNKDQWKWNGKAKK
jgi:hypothetical protein